MNVSRIDTWQTPTNTADEAPATVARDSGHDGRQHHIARRGRQRTTDCGNLPVSGALVTSVPRGGGNYRIFGPGYYTGGHVHWNGERWVCNVLTGNNHMISVRNIQISCERNIGWRCIASPAKPLRERAANFSFDAICSVLPQSGTMSLRGLVAQLVRAPA
jgi:hypothetical protein